MFEIERALSIMVYCGTSRPWGIFNLLLFLNYFKTNSFELVFSWKINLFFFYFFIIYFYYSFLFLFIFYFCFFIFNFSSFYFKKMKNFANSKNNFEIVNGTLRPPYTCLILANSLFRIKTVLYFYRLIVLIWQNEKLNDVVWWITVCVKGCCSR